MIIIQKNETIVAIRKKGALHTTKRSLFLLYHFNDTVFSFIHPLSYQQGRAAVHLQYA